MHLNLNYWQCFSLDVIHLFSAVVTSTFSIRSTPAALISLLGSSSLSGGTIVACYLNHSSPVVEERPRRRSFSFCGKNCKNHHLCSISTMYSPNFPRTFPSVLLLAWLLLGTSFAQNDPVKNFCRRWGHQSAVVDRKLYIDGGLINYEDATNNLTSQHFYQSI